MGEMKQELKKLRKDVERYEGQIAMHTKMNNAKKIYIARDKKDKIVKKRKIK